MDYGQLLNLNTSKISTAAGNAGALSGKMSNHGGTVKMMSIMPIQLWLGPDASANTALLSPQAEPLSDVSDMANKAKSSLETLVTELNAAKTRLEHARDRALSLGLIISPDGRVSPPPEQVGNFLAFLQAQDVQELIDQAIKDANLADQKAVEGLAACTKDIGAAATGAMVKVFGPVIEKGMDVTAFLNRHTGNLSKIGVAELSKLKTPEGYPSSLSNLSERWQVAKKIALNGVPETVPKPGWESTVSKLEKVSKVTGPVGKLLAVGTAGNQQLQADWSRTDLTTDEKLARAGYRATVQGGGGILGAAAGTATFAGTCAAVGSAVPGVGTVAGGVGCTLVGIGGGLLGGWGGSELGKVVADHTMPGGK